MLQQVLTVFFDNNKIFLIFLIECRSIYKYFKNHNLNLDNNLIP
jgi:hypothetical protein